MNLARTAGRYAGRYVGRYAGRIHHPRILAFLLAVIAGGVLYNVWMVPYVKRMEAEIEARMAFIEERGRLIQRACHVEYERAEWVAQFVHTAVFPEEPPREGWFDPAWHIVGGLVAEDFGDPRPASCERERCMAAVYEGVWVDCETGLGRDPEIVAYERRFFPQRSVEEDGREESEGDYP